MKVWLRGLSQPEIQQRTNFQNQFKPYLVAFNALQLSNVRHVSVHRSGVIPLEATITGRFGVVYRGSATEAVPPAETPTLADPTDQLLLAKMSAIQPMPSDFTIN